MGRYINTLVVLVLALHPLPSHARRASLIDLRSWLDGKGNSAELKRRLERLGVSRLLRMLVHVEPHEAQSRGMQRFETEHGAYYVIPPRRYSPKKAWPLHIALHGHGSSQTGRVACKTYWKGEPERNGVILACPDLRAKWTSKRGEQLVLATYKDVQQRFNVRTDHVSLGGFSGGGIGAWILGPRYPDLFSALVPRAGIPPRAEEVIRNLNGLPLYLIHGKRDSVIPVKHSRRIADELTRLKIDHIYKETGGGHEFYGRLNDTVIRWLKKKKRKLSRDFRYHGPVSGPPRIIHWLQLTGRGRVTVRGRIIKRRRIVIDIDHPERLERLDIHLTRKLFDMRRRAVDVVVNGKAFRYRVRETAGEVLDSYAITRDLRRVFTARLTLTRKSLKKVRPKPNL